MSIYYNIHSNAITFKVFKYKYTLSNILYSRNKNAFQIIYISY